MARSLAVLGTGSDVGKSVVTAALCRIASDAGLDVAPYKAQNMSNNAGVTPDGGEMGRAQIVQAEAARQVPHVDMNPVLLKPTSDRRSQVVLLGRVLADVEAGAYFRDTAALRAAAYGALDRLRARHDALVLEGAGSCAEVNLRARDFVNFDAAHAADADVVLVADIHRGGVFAQLAGTLEILPPADRARVTGLVVNRFRGDITLFEDGVRWLEQRTGLPVLGVIPYFRGIRIEDEDGLSPDIRVDPPAHGAGRPPEGPGRSPDGADRVRVAVLGLPHMANFTDVRALDRVPGASVHWLRTPRDLTPYDWLVIPGTKNTRADLDALRAAGWEAPLTRFVRGGGHVLGLCGGYQMLGHTVADPDGVEGTPGETAGLGLLDARTVLRAPKVTTRTGGQLAGSGEGVDGYEIHMGRTEVRAAPLLRITRRSGAPLAEPEDEGAVSPDGHVVGTYLHGLLDSPAALAALLRRVRPGDAFADVEALSDAAADRDAQYDRLAAHVRANLDVDRLLARMGAPR